MSDFAPVHQAAEVMRAFDAPWFVAGGWAIDLFAGRITREHEDVDVAILRRDHAALRRHLAAWSLQKVAQGQSVTWRDDEPLEPPIHELHARREDGDLRHLEILIDEASGDLWRFRRNPRIARPIHDIALVSPEGIPYLAPEIVLLYKGKGTRPRDERDFDVTRPLLDRSQTEWLGYALQECHPDHPWIPRLRGPST